MKLRFLLLLLISALTFNYVAAEQEDKDISFYTGTFDLIDKEGDDKTSLFGIEHKNPNLFRDTFLGEFKPVTGGFITGNSSIYLYTGIEAQYGIGPLKILPSFTPGYYEKGDGKDSSGWGTFSSRDSRFRDIKGEKPTHLHRCNAALTTILISMHAYSRHLTNVHFNYAV